MKKRIFLAAMMIVSLGLASATQTNRGANAAQPGWSPVIVATGSYRRQIQSTPIELRPYRPLHFYGNTVRRRYYQGQPYSRPLNTVSPLQAMPQRVYPNTFYRGY